jgi:hypothetical protein
MAKLVVVLVDQEVTHIKIQILHQLQCTLMQQRV